MTEISTIFAQIQYEDLVSLGKLLIASVGIPLLLFFIRQLYKDFKKRQDRRRKLYAEAFSACMEYKEFPFVIYRRGKSNPEAERIRISENLREVQKRISYYQAWIRTESSSVSEVYNKLITRLREIPGKKMNKAWKAKPTERDDQMNITTPIDWKDLKDFEDQYINAVRNELRLFGGVNIRLSVSVLMVLLFLAILLISKGV
ncbi:hypothetical protein KY385_03280 [Candidatus Parcubacteria bacterium]|nr:hypothetical protein [Candidatus Parcubacteria bacterium]